MAPPRPLLKTGISMILIHNGASSSPKSLPGSSPQGAFLGIFFFVLKYNAASMRPAIPRLAFNQSGKKKLSNCKKQDCSAHAKDIHALYIDDLTESVAVNLEKQVIDDPQQLHSTQ